MTRVLAPERPHGSALGARTEGLGAGEPIFWPLRAVRSTLALLLCAASISCAPTSVGVHEIELRPDDPRATTPRFDEGDVVERMASPGGRFVVHFTRDGTHRVPPDDVDASGVPDYVEQVARTYDEALAAFVARGFREPLSDVGAPDGDGGDGRFDVYLVDFAGVADGAFRRDVCGLGRGGACSGHMVQENDFAGYSFASRTAAIRILASHELFHAVQAAYDDEQTAVFGEGTAVWASETFDPSTDDLERFSRAYLGATTRSLGQSVGGPVDPYSYGAGVFFQFSSERYGDEVIRELLEDVEDGAHGIADPQWLDALDALLARTHGASFEAAWIEHAQWNLRTGRFADAARGYASGAAFAEIAPTEIALPHRDERVRVLPASARYFEASIEGREQIGIELVAPEGRESATVGLWMLIGWREVGGAGELRVARAVDGALSIEAPSGGRVVVAIVRADDHDEAGEGRVPALCVGDPTELASCRASLSSDVDAAIESDAGLYDDAAITPDAGPSTAPTAGCACRASPHSGASPWALSLIACAFGCATLRRNRGPR